MSMYCWFFPSINWLIAYPVMLTLFLEPARRAVKLVGFWGLGGLPFHSYLKLILKSRRFARLAQSIEMKLTFRMRSWYYVSVSSQYILNMADTKQSAWKPWLRTSMYSITGAQSFAVTGPTSSAGVLILLRCSARTALISVLTASELSSLIVSHEPSLV